MPTETPASHGWSNSERRLGDRRKSSRRTEDRVEHQAQLEKIRKLKSFLELGQIIGLDLQVEGILIQIARKAVEVMGADRGTVYLHDAATDELWSKMALGLEGREIRMPASAGLAGHCFRNGETLNLEDAYEDVRFNRSVDARTGYRTRSVLCMPIYGRTRETLGVIQLINKKDGHFSDEDETYLRNFRNHAAVFIEMAQLQKARIDALQESREELQLLNRVKDKAIHHLSHEIKTPLSVIRGTLGSMKKKTLASLPSGGWGRMFERMEKQLARLVEIETEVDEILQSSRDIHRRGLVHEFGEMYRRVMDHADMTPQIEEHFRAIRSWMDGWGRSEPTRLPSVSLGPSAQKTVRKAKEMAPQRGVRLHRQGELATDVDLPLDVLEDILDGFVKNALENTPDGSRVLIAWEPRGDRVLVKVEDHGVGITLGNQRHIFDGLFHTQDTEWYSSRRPYEFNAGGKGLDLLRIKTYSQRFGFGLGMESRRCIHLPTDRDVCPGRVADCPHCRGPEDCLESGGSTFWVSLPQSRGRMT
jgi:signal transduction histidine kinase